MPRPQTPSQKATRPKSPSTQKKRSTATASGGSPTKRVVVAYAWENNKVKEYVFQVGEDGVLNVFTPNDKGELILLAINKIKKLDRLIFYSLSAEKPEPLLILDTIPTDDTKIDIKKSGTRTSLEIRLDVRTLFMARQFVDVTIVIEQAKPKETPVYQKFKFFDSGMATEKDILDATKSLEKTLTDTSEINPFIALPNGTIAPAKLRRALGLSLAEDTAANPCTESGVTEPNLSRLQVFFVRLGILNGSGSATGPFLISFRMIKQDAGKCPVPPVDPTNKLRTFSGRADIEVDQKLLKKKTWALLQRPSINITVGPKSPPEPGENFPASHWVLQVHGVPAKGIPGFWNEEFADPYFKALNIVQSGGPVSFLPALDEITDNQLAAVRWAIAYKFKDPTDKHEPDYEFGDDPGKVSFSGLSLQLAQTTPLLMTGSLRQLKDHQDAELKVELNVNGNVEESDQPTLKKASQFEKFPGVLLRLSKAVENKAQKEVRMGALDLQFAGRQTSDNSNNNLFRVNPEGDYFAVHIESDFAVARVGPGGQDDLPGEEFVPEAGESFGSLEPCVIGDKEVGTKSLGPEDVERVIESNFRRKSPLVIVRDYTPATDKDKFLLHVSEHAQKLGSQTIRLNLQNNTGQASKIKDEQVVVLDRNPFLVALVQFVPFSRQSSMGGNSIGNWTNAGLEGSNWELRTGAAPFELILPPQGVGEEMEKSHTLKKDPADFRLGRPAHLTLDPSFFQQNFTEAPWNLRRILGYPGQRSPGPAIKRIQFELLYGLSCDVTYPFLRLAEISALTGAIPGRLPRDIRWQASSRQMECFQQARLSWSLLYRRYLSRLGILEPWDTHRPESLTINEGMVCRIRANTTEGMTAPFAELQDPINERVSTDLKGGVTWGFESKNVYNAVLTNPPAGISTSASISEPLFSSLGAWGRLKSSFDKDRSTVYADAAMGRTYYYKLERIGRIACWWNKAKHVIVYERTVIPSRQFFQQQDRQEGTALVRKVHEYVQILEKSRSYPDGNQTRTAQEEDALRVQRGFVSECAFEEGAKFAVQSSWGTDVGDIGWKVPIWDPGATPADVYPKPNVKFGLYSHVDGKSVPVHRRCKDPQNIYFYTDTRKETGADPNDWPPVKDVDYCDLPRPEPRRDFEDGKTVQSTPDDPNVHPGFGPCTFTLEPTAVPADLVAERSQQPLASVLENITMMRAAAIDIAKPDAAYPAANTLRRLTDRVADAYTEILRAVPATEAAQQAARAEILKKVSESFNNGKFKALTNDLDKVVNALKAQETQLLQNIKNREAELFTSLRKQVDKLANDVIKDYAASIATLMPGREAALNNIRREIRALQEGLMLLRASPGMLQKLLKRYVDEAAPLVTTAKAEVQRIVTLIDTFSDSLTPDQLKQFATEARKVLEAVAVIEQALRSAGHRRPEEWIPDPTRAVLAEFFTGGETKLREVKQALEQKLAEIQAGTTLAKDAAKKLINDLNAWDQTKIDKLAADSAAKVEQKLQELISTWIADREKELLALIPGDPTPAQLQATLDRLKDVLTNSSATNNILKPLNDLEAEVRTQSDNLIDYVSKEAAEVEAELKKLNQAAVEAVVNKVKELRNEIEAQRDRFFNTANDYVDKNIRRLLPIAESVYSVADPAIRIIRAFGRPPEVPNLTFQRPAVAYFYKEASKIVDITPVLSRVRQASEALEALKPVGVDLPTEKLLERLVPPNLRNFNLSDIFPSFAGLNLSNLFSGLKMPSVANDNLKISHGADAQTGRAWVEANIDIKTEEPATVFSFGPVMLRLPTARFQASARFEASLNEPPRRTVSGVISGDWELSVAGMKLVIFRRTELRFDDAGGLRFNISPNNIELPGVLALVSDLLSSFAGSDSGFSIGLLPTGVKAQLILPVPNIQGGTSGISNLTIGMVFKIQFSDSDFNGAFTLSLSFLLARKEAPFTITVFILGGGGYVDLTTTYAPSQQRLVSAIEVGITAGASLGLSLGPIHGSVYVFLGITARFAIDTRPQPTGPQQGLTFGVLLIIGGEVSVLGIVSASITLLLEVLYSSGRLIGHGRISIKIEICWCFTLEVEEDVTYEVGSGDSSQKVASAATRRMLNGHHASFAAAADSYDTFAKIYIDMLV